MKNDEELVEKEHTFYRGINSTYWKKLAVFKNIRKRKKHERREKVCRIKKEEREIKKWWHWWIKFHVVRIYHSLFWVKLIYGLIDLHASRIFQIMSSKIEFIWMSSETIFALFNTGSPLERYAIFGDFLMIIITPLTRMKSKLELTFIEQWEFSLYNVH